MTNLATGSALGAAAPREQPLTGVLHRLDVRPLAWAMLLSGALIVLDFAGWYGYIVDQPVRILTQALAYAVVGGWLLVALMRPRWLPRTPLAAPVIAAAAVFVLASVFSQRPRLSAEATLIGLGAAAMFLFLTRLAAEPWFRVRMRVVLVLVPVVVAVAYVPQVLLTWVEWWGLIGALSVPPLRPGWAGLMFGSPNLVATVLLLTGPLACALLRERHQRIAVALGILFVAAIGLSGSRGALISVALAGLLAFLIFVRRHGGIRAIGSQAMVAATGLLVAFGAVAVPIVASRLGQSGELLRMDLWRSALAIFTDHPLLGGGPGTWVQLKIAASPAGATNLVLPHAQDLFVQTLAEVGIVGSVGLAVLAVAVVRRLMSAARARTTSLGLEATAVLLALVAYAGQSLVDATVNLPAILLLLLLVIAWVEGGLALTSDATPPARRPARATRPGVGRAVAGLALITLVVSILPLAAFDRAALSADDGNQAASLGDWTTALTSYQAAAAQDPGIVLYQLEEATALARLGRAAEARVVLRSAVTQDQVALNWVSLAALDAAAGDCGAAMDHAAIAMTRGPSEAGVALNAGAVAEGCGSTDQAGTWYAAALAAAPPLAADPYWIAPARASQRASIVVLAHDRLVAAGDPADAALVNAYAGNTTAAQAELAALSGPCETCEAAAQYLSGDRAGAVAFLQSRLVAHPLDWLAATALARYAWFSGNTDGALKYQRMAEIVQGDATPSVVTAPNRIEVDAHGGQLQPVNYPWAVYLRNGPNTFWVPGLLTPVFAR